MTRPFRTAIVVLVASFLLPTPAVPSYGATLAPKMPVGAVVVPALEGGSTNIWQWNDRADIDLAKWRSLGKN